ncbi:MAG: LysR family transcriptional regulator [Alphaproteobacteria bacterium]|nr:LysR family transcriptional regulator [Alphaproteobacteria bacterium]
MATVDMNVRQLEAFRAVMAAGTVTRAAQSLNVSQPAVSQLIAQLERSCGFALFSRETGRLQPTREADALLAEVQQLFTGVQRVARVATALRELNWGVLNLGSFPAMAKRLLPEIVAGYCHDRPEVRFRLESMRSRSLIDAIASQHIDLGLSIIPGDREEVDSRHLHALPAICILPRGHRLERLATIAAKDLAGERFISLGRQDYSRVFIDKIFDDAQIPRRIQIETGQSEAAYALVARGAGVSVIDPMTVYDHRDDRVVMRPFTPRMTFSVWLLSPRRKRPMLLLEDFETHLRRELALFARSVGAVAEEPDGKQQAGH